MRYTLMHKNIPVLEMTIDENSAAISFVGECFAPERLPVSVGFMHGKPNKGTLNDWWGSRSIPASRLGLRDALEILNVGYSQKLLTKCFGLSLSDQYWVNPTDNPMNWDDINFFDNLFSKDVGNALFGTAPKDGKLNLMSPDNTSDGWLRKKWAIIDGKRCLIKAGSGTTHQEPVNEVLASIICKRLKIPHIPYTLIYEDEYPYSVCENFVTRETELITAWHILQTEKKPNHASYYQHYLNRCEEMGIPGIPDAVDQMLSLDYIIANEDRHLNNFGVIRNADTLEYIGAAPVFDSGSSLWFNTPTARIRANTTHKSKPFRNEHSEQIKLVKSFDWLDFSKLKDIDEEFSELVKGSEFIDETRKNALIIGFNKRIEMLSEIVMNHVPQIISGKTEYDIEEDIAYSGTDNDESENEMQML